jgi:hypothetical protein
VTIVNTFTRQRVHRQTVTAEMKTRTVQGGVCYPNHLAGINGSQFRSKKRNPCGGGVEYLHRDPASRRRRRKGSLKSDTVKYGRKSQGARTREWLRWLGPAAIVNDRPVLSSERAPPSTNPQLSGSNKNLVVSPRWVLYSNPDWPTDRRS